jgi:hypothetical protein
MAEYTLLSPGSASGAPAVHVESSTWGWGDCVKTVLEPARLLEPGNVESSTWGDRVKHGMVCLALSFPGANVISFSPHRMDAKPQYSRGVYYSSVPEGSSVLWEPRTEQAAVGTATIGNAEPAAEAEVPDHLEPTTFAWTRSGFKARAAFRQFSESVHGDH